MDLYLYADTYSQWELARQWAQFVLGWYTVAITLTYGRYVRREHVYAVAVWRKGEGVQS